MKKLLITCFEPFGDDDLNSSCEAVFRLPDEIAEYSLTKLCLPVVFGEAAEKVIDVSAKLRPDAILCIGQAGGRDAITPEMLGINLRFASISDNKGNQPKDEPVTEGGREAYFSTLPVRKITDAISSLGIAARISYSAGTYVCNDLLYTLLSYFDGTKTRVAFIHVPYFSDQKKEPSMSISDIVKGLEIAIKNID